MSHVIRYRCDTHGCGNLSQPGPTQLEAQARATRAGWVSGTSGDLCPVCVTRVFAKPTPDATNAARARTTPVTARGSTPNGTRKEQPCAPVTFTAATTRTAQPAGSPDTDP